MEKKNRKSYYITGLWSFHMRDVCFFRVGSGKNREKTDFSDARYTSTSEIKLLRSKMLYSILKKGFEKFSFMYCKCRCRCRKIEKNWHDTYVLILLFESDKCWLRARFQFSNYFTTYLSHVRPSSFSVGL